MNTILIAKTSARRLFYLHPLLSREELTVLRSQEQFFCPDCDASLLLKIGNIKIPHFAHKSRSECATFSEAESPIHLLGKSKLHTFFTQKNHHTELEKYFPRIRQRADLLIDQKFAIEFQCSPLPVDKIEKRSVGYQSANIKPLWLLSAKGPMTEGVQLIKLRSFEQALIEEGMGCTYLLAFDPVNNCFYYYSSLFYIKGFQWIAKIRSLTAEKQTFPFALPKKLTKAEFNQLYELASVERQRIVRNHQFVQNRYRNLLWRLCYELQLDLNNLPLTIGIPFIKNRLMAESSILWQLQAILAYSKGSSMKQLIHSGQVKLAVDTTEKEASALLECYLEIHISVKKQENNEALLLELLYDNYCKNV